MKIIFVYCLIILFACTGSEAPQFIKVKEIAYQTGTSVLWRNNGVFIDSETKQEYLYFADVTTGKDKIMFFTVDGELKQEVPIKEVLSGRTVNGVVVKGWDTIIIIEKAPPEYNRLSFTDRRGHLLRRINLNHAVFKDNPWDMFLYGHSPLGNSLYGNYLYLSSHWNRRIGEPRIENEAERIQHFYREAYQYPPVVQYNIETMECKQAFREMWRTFCPDTNLSFSYGIRFTCENGLLFISSNISSDIYVADALTMEIKDIIKIKSNYTQIGAKPYSRGNQGQFNVDELITGQILSVLYDQYNDLYYVTIRHGAASEDQAPFFSEQPFSVQIYNSGFEKLQEQYFEGKQYDARDCMVTQQGLLIKHNDNKKDYNPEVTKYDLYELKK